MNKQELLVLTQIVKNENVDNANTATRIGTILEEIVNSSINKEELKQEPGSDMTVPMSQGSVTEEIHRIFLENIKSWVLSESFSITNPTFDNRGNLTGGVITWPDGDIGSISNVVTGTHGVTSIRYNRSVAGQYVTVNITYNSNGIVQAQEALLTGF